MLWAIMRAILRRLSRPGSTPVVLGICNSLGILLIVLSLLRVIGAMLVVSDPLPPQPADAVVPLAGDPARAKYATGLLVQDHASWILVTNAYSPVPANRWPSNVYSTRTSREVTEYGAPAEKIWVDGRPVRTTYEELRSIRNFAEERGWRSLIIVTSRSHTLRTQLMVRDLFAASNIQVTVHAMTDDWYTVDYWWTRRGGWNQTVSEYVKLLVYLVGLRI